MITKNAGMLRDKDISLKNWLKKLISILVTITTTEEELRQKMEPRTTTANQRFRLIKELSNVGVRMGVMMGPMIPGLNDHDMQKIMKKASENGAVFSAYTFIRLMGTEYVRLQKTRGTVLPVWELTDSCQPFSCPQPSAPTGSKQPRQLNILTWPCGIVRSAKSFFYCKSLHTCCRILKSGDLSNSFFR